MAIRTKTKELKRKKMETGKAGPCHVAQTEWTKNQLHKVAGSVVGEKRKWCRPQPSNPFGSFGHPFLSSPAELIIREVITTDNTGNLLASGGIDCRPVNTWAPVFPLPCDLAAVGSLLKTSALFVPDSRVKSTSIRSRFAGNLCSDDSL